MHDVSLPAPDWHLHVVDDDAPFRRSLVFLLESMGWQVTPHASAADFLAACRALERVVSHSHYLLPQWYSPTHRLAYNAWRLARPDVPPPYSPGEMWAVNTWWATPENLQKR